MDTKRVLTVVLVVGFAGWFWAHRAKDASPQAAAPSPGSAPSAPGPDCVGAADRANAALRDASTILTKLPVDPSAWSTAESNVSSLISQAEGACPSGAAAEEAKTALSLMRASLSDLSSAARGAGGASDIAKRQGEIDAHLDKARSLR